MKRKWEAEWFYWGTVKNLTTVQWQYHTSISYFQTHYFFITHDISPVCTTSTAWTQCQPYRTVHLSDGNSNHLTFPVTSRCSIKHFDHHFYIETPCTAWKGHRDFLHFRPWHTNPTLPQNTFLGSEFSTVFKETHSLVVLKFLFVWNILGVVLWCCSWHVITSLGLASFSMHWKYFTAITDGIWTGFRNSSVYPISITRLQVINIFWPFYETSWVAMTLLL